MPPLTSFLIAPRKEDHVNNNKQNRFQFDKINSVKNQCPALLENQLTANMLIDLVAGDAFVLAQPPSREDRFLKSERSAGITGSVNWHLRELHDSKLIPSAAWWVGGCTQFVLYVPVLNVCLTYFSAIASALGCTQVVRPARFLR